MFLVDGGLACPGVLELSTWRHIPSSRRHIPHRPRLCCYAKSKVNDDEQKHQTSGKGFSIRVPTIPKLGDSESARRLLESAFQALSFEMPKLPIESALQGLSFDISRFSIPKQIFIFDITGFVTTKLRRPQQEVADPILDQCQYPRCAWPRTSKGAQVGEVSVATTGTTQELQRYDHGLKPTVERSTTVYPHCKWPRATLKTLKSELGNEAPLGKRPGAVSVGGINGEACSKIPLGPHCAWPRIAQRVTNANGSSSSQSISSALLYPHSAWPRRSLSGNAVFSSGGEAIPEPSSECSTRKAEGSSIIQGGARCAWPRKTIPAKRSCQAEKTTDVSENLQIEVLEGEEDSDGGKRLPADIDAASTLPRRMLATSVGLTVMNQLARGAFIVSSSRDFFSLLPAGPLEIAAEEEDATLDLGRRTLMVFIRSY